MESDRRFDILAFIERFTSEHQYPPTIREIGQAFGIASTNGVRYHLNRLERDGMIKRTGSISRGLFSVRDHVRSVPRHAGIPILGRVAAGQPILAEESYEGRLETDDLFGTTKELFALRVRGDSMIEAGIHENDYVIVRHQESATSGEMVVALIEDEATVKYYRPAGDAIELAPANARYQPIRVRKGDSFRIIGVVRGVIRTISR